MHPGSQQPSRQERPEIEKIVLLMVSGMKGRDLEAAITEKLGLPPEELRSALDAARRKLAQAAAYDREEKAGAAIVRLEDLYARAIRAQDIKTALGAQRELNKLFGLYHDTTGAPGEEHHEAASETAAELEAIRAHLEPLGLAGAGYPLAELARLAAEIVRESQADEMRRKR